MILQECCSSADTITPAAGRAPSVVDVSWVTGIAGMEALESEWRALEPVVRNRTVFATFDLLATWYRNYAGPYGGDPLIGVARDQHRIVGIAPLVIRPGRIGKIPITRVQFATHDAHSGEFLIEDDRPETAAAFVDSLAREIDFGMACFNGLEPGSDFFHWVQRSAAAKGLGVERTTHENAIVNLRGGYEAYCESMSRNFRRTVKRQARRVADAGTPAVDGVRLWSGLDQLERCIERLFGVTEASYKLQGQRLADCHRNYLAGLARAFGSRGMLHLSILSIGGRDAAVVMGVVERGCYYDVTLAYAEEFAELSPGAHLMQKVLQNLAETGIHTLVSHGAHEYKRRWSTAFVPSTRVFLFARRCSALLSRFLRFRMAPIWRRLGASDP